MLPMVLLAGGLATRLRPLTEQIPKALIDILDYPFIHHQLLLLKKNHFKEIVLCIGYLGEQLKAYVGNGARYGLDVIYSEEGNSLLGTAGAIKKALPLLGNDFFVMNGDSYLPCDYAAIQAAYYAAKKPGLMTVFKNQNRWDKSNVEFSQDIIQKYDKTIQTSTMQFIDYGLSVLNKNLFASIPDNKVCDLTIIYQALIAKNELAGFEIKQRFYENGSFSGIKDLEEFLSIRL